MVKKSLIAAGVALALSAGYAHAGDHNKMQEEVIAPLMSTEQYAEEDMNAMAVEAAAEEVAAPEIKDHAAIFVAEKRAAKKRPEADARSEKEIELDLIRASEAEAERQIEREIQQDAEREAEAEAEQGLDSVISDVINGLLG
jgi:hypothetical protein